MSTPIRTELKETFTPNSTIRNRLEALSKQKRLSSGNSDPIQLRVFVGDDGKAIHMGVVEGMPRKTPHVIIDLKREPIITEHHHPLYLKATNYLRELSAKFSEWVEANTPKKPKTVYRSSYQVV